MFFQPDYVSIFFDYLKKNRNLDITTDLVKNQHL